MQAQQILVLSNGHGEDIIAATILRDLLKKAPDLQVSVLPIVGEGKAYADLPVNLLGPRKNLPSGGFMRQNWRNFWMDFRAGLFGNTLSQIHVMRSARQDASMVLCVGDALLVILAGLFVKRRMVFLPTAKSEYISGHYGIEKWLMRKYASLVLPRDAKTAKVLTEEGVPAQFVGNAMMDSFTIMGIDFGKRPEARVVGILPGSRGEAYDNMRVILRIVRALEDSGEKLDYLTALADQIDIAGFLRIAGEIGWKMVEEAELAHEGVVSVLISPGGSRVKLTKGRFGDFLQQSDIFIGLSGTGNEQAVGMGKPLVAFPGTGTQFTEAFMRAQKKLLGDSIAIFDPDPEQVAQGLLDILHDPARYKAMGEVGRERMGPTGGISRMSDLILKEFFLTCRI